MLRKGRGQEMSRRDGSDQTGFIIELFEVIS